jgi:AcrR family transcriptional regulator
MKEIRSKRTFRRGRAVARQTLKAVIAELGRVGYAALRIEDVALRAGVNKTTVYRHWPTKALLVKAALVSIAEVYRPGDIPDTGSVRNDLITVARSYVAAVNSPEGRTIMRMMAADQPDAAVLAIIRSIQKTQEAVPRAILERAQARGELRSSVSATLLSEILRASCDRSAPNAKGNGIRRFTQTVDLLLEGALAVGAKPRRRDAAP